MVCCPDTDTGTDTIRT